MCHRWRRIGDIYQRQQRCVSAYFTVDRSYDADFLDKNHDRGHADDRNKHNHSVGVSLTKTSLVITNNSLPLQFSPTSFWDSRTASGSGWPEVGRN